MSRARCAEIMTSSNRLGTRRTQSSTVMRAMTAKLQNRERHRLLVLYPMSQIEANAAPLGARPRTASPQMVASDRNRKFELRRCWGRVLAQGRPAAYPNLVHSD